MTEFAGKRTTTIAIIVLAALSALGIGCWIAQVASGDHLLNLTNYDMWGIYLAGFTIGTGIAAGSLLFVSAACLLPSCASWFPYARIAAFAGGIGGTVMAGLFIMADLGAPWRAWEIIVMLHPGSPLFWDTMILSAFLVIAIVLTVKLKGACSPTDKGIKALGIIALVAGLCVVITSYVFAFQVSKPSWNGTGQVASFFVVAVAAAFAFVAIVVEIAAKAGFVKKDEEALRRMGLVAAAACVAELVLALSEIALGVFAGAGEHFDAAVWLAAGPGAPFFWVEIAAFVAAIALWIFGRASAARASAAALALIAALLVKYNLLQAALFNPVIDLAGFPGYSGIIAGSYAPSLVEWGVTIGIIAIVALICTVGFAKFNLAATKQD
ncbi:NrfD/PsrC family molybdoenzyme membrane anchor subunit [Slackia piriformis]|uniref:NrfD/PsrC family molybdoenzyme membrane anchor subunit n=1 Tax=Slackia piriformis TaxID=626934 RepID=UPI0026DA9675|nr:NrfD/PsrC family molybdoenzyme membrane anchor subunit [Slackia piriformis]MDO5024826.1 polysulfide reductase NrfD [Slackia piriformis]